MPGRLVWEDEEEGLLQLYLKGPSCAVHFCFFFFAADLMEGAVEVKSIIDPWTSIIMCQLFSFV